MPRLRVSSELRLWSRNRQYDSAEIHSGDGFEGTLGSVDASAGFDSAGLASEDLVSSGFDSLELGSAVETSAALLSLESVVVPLGA